MEFRLKDDFIKLGQAMKATGLAATGIEAKIAIQNGEVSVNGEVDTRRGRKLVENDTFTYMGKTVKIIK